MYGRSREHELFSTVPSISASDDGQPCADARPAVRSAAPVEMPAPQSTVIIDAADSDFLKAVSGKSTGAAWKIMDELMESLHVMQPRTYNAVMRQLREM